jgi:hypothetical protein
MIAHVSAGGRRVRVELSNIVGAQPLEIGAAHLAIHKGQGEVVPGTDRELRFGGSTAFTIPPGAIVASDPVDLQIAAFSDLAVSLYLPKDTGMPANHNVGLHTAYISKCNVDGSAKMPEAANMLAYVWLAAVDVVAPNDAFTVVALGDSITDGFATTPDADMAWPTLLAKRMRENKARRMRRW